MLYCSVGLLQTDADVVALAIDSGIDLVGDAVVTYTIAALDPACMGDEETGHLLYRYPRSDARMPANRSAKPKHSLAKLAKASAKIILGSTSAGSDDAL